MAVASLRVAIVAEACSWLGTRYEHMGRVKVVRDETSKIIDSGGTDCGQLVYLVFYALGLCKELPLEYYPPDWHIHRDQDRYLSIVLERAHEIDPSQAKPGDVVLYRWGRLYAHGGIVVERGEYETIIHASSPDGAVVKTRADAGRLGRLKRRYFSVFGASAPKAKPGVGPVGHADQMDVAAGVQRRSQGSGCDRMSEVGRARPDQPHAMPEGSRT